jgi:hypothetical protein
VNDHTPLVIADGDTLNIASSTIDGKTVHNNGSPCEIVVSRGEMNMGRIVVDLSDRQLAHSTGSDGR